MNERIIELAKTAGLKFPSETALSPSEEKFAELIVRECIARVQLQNRMDETTEQWVYDNLVDDFKEHFGVKE